MPRVRKSIADWRAAVYAYRGQTGFDGTRVMLLFLADHMKTNRMVSIPQSQIAKALGVDPRRIKERIKTAVDAGLLDHVVWGKPGTTAVYQGMFPDEACAAGPAQEKPRVGTPWSPSQVPALCSDEGRSTAPSDGADVRTKQTPSYGADVAHPTSKQSATDPISKTERSESKAVPRSAQAPTQLEKNESSSFIVGAERLRSARETPSGAARGTRATALDLIQASAADGGYAGGEDLWAVLEDMHDGLGDWAGDYWHFPKLAATDRKEAGKQLNMLINTWRQEAA